MAADRPSPPDAPGGASGRLDRLYARLVGEDGAGGDARVCGDLSDEACREVPRSFFLYVGSLVLTKLGDAIASPKTTLAFVMGALAVPPSLVGLLVPIRESGSMLPQIFTAGPIRRLAIRKWVWVIGSLLQALAVAAMGIAVLAAEGALAGWAILAAVAVFALVRSLSSVASKDVKGKTLPKTRRGQASGLADSTSGALVMAAALALLLLRRGDVATAFYGWLLIGLAALWIVAALLYSRIREQPGPTSEGEPDGATAVLRRLSLLARDAAFRRFVLTRALLMSTALAGPYYVLLARQNAGGEVSLLALFILAGGLASTLSSTFWGRWADRSSRRVLIAAACLASGLGVVTFAAVRAAPSFLDRPWIYAVAFFVLGVAHSGVRLGRKTYVVDMAEGNRRTDYVAVSNTAIGALLLLSGALGPLVGVIGASGMLLVLALAGFAGAALGLGLPEVEGG